MRHHKHNAEYDPVDDYEEDEQEETEEYDPEPSDWEDPEAKWEKEYDAYCDWLDNMGRPAGDQR